MTRRGGLTGGRLTPRRSAAAPGLPTSDSALKHSLPIRCSLRPPPPAFPWVRERTCKWPVAPLRQRMALACGPKEASNGERGCCTCSHDSLHEGQLGCEARGQIWRGATRWMSPRDSSGDLYIMLECGSRPQPARRLLSQTSAPTGHAPSRSGSGMRPERRTSGLQASASCDEVDRQRRDDKRGSRRRRG